MKPNTLKIIGQIIFSIVAGLFLGLLTGRNGFAQSLLKPLSGESRFQRQLDAVQWRYAGGYNFNRKRVSVAVNDRWTSSLFLQNGEAQNVQEENRFDVFLAAPVSKNWRMFFQGNQFGFKAGDVQQWWGVAGAERQFLNGIALNAGVGVLSDQRNGLRDEGLFLKSTLAGPAIRWNDFQFQPSVRSEYGDISPRRFSAVHIETPVHYEVEKFQLDGRFKQSYDIRESYQAINFLNRNARDAIESIRTDTSSLYLYTNVYLGKGWNSTFEADGRTISRSYKYEKLIEDDERLFFDTEFLARKLDVRVTSRKQWKRLLVDTGAGYGVSADEAALTNAESLPLDQVRRRKEILENSIFSQNRLSVFLAVGSAAESRRKWMLRGNASILRHNTPDANPDDRDEQQLHLYGELKYPISEFITVSSGLSTERVQNVYLFARRSAENNDRYSLRLTPSVLWTPTPEISISQQLLLRSNYTVYVFPNVTPGITNQSSREYGHKTEAIVKISKTASANVSIQRNELRIGRLFWEGFRETPLDTLVTWDISVSATRYFHSGWATLGFRWFSKWDFMPIAANQLVFDDLTSITVRGPGRFATYQYGPTIDVRFPFESRHELLIRGWYQIQATRQSLYADYPEEWAGAFVDNETNFPRRVFPNLEMIARVRF